jgi:flagellar biosynthetic protein FlhB
MEQPDEIAETSRMLKVMGFTFETILLTSLPLMLVALVAGVTMAYLQVGVLFTLKPIQPKLDKINPINGFKRLFSIRSLVELLKSVLKATLLLYITGSYIVARQNELLTVFSLSITQIVGLMWDIVFNLMLRAVMVLLLLAVLDYAYKRWQNEKDMMMSKQEIKDEYKMTEGDPQLKGKIKQKQREISMGRMMQEVPGADVIITNPTHYAVAVQYDPDRADAPKVIAKGKNLIAKNIKKIAEENDIPIVENKPLARALYAEVELGAFIPANLYHAVAEVLAYVYKLKKSS